MTETLLTPQNKWIETINNDKRPLGLYNTTYGQLTVAQSENGTWSVVFITPDMQFKVIKTGVKQRGRARRIALNWHKKEFKQ